MSSKWTLGQLTAAPNEKIQGHLHFEGVSEPIPAFLINGEAEGPKVLVLGGIHGCEYTSIDAALEIGKQLQAGQVKGKVAVIPIANPASFYKRSIYVHPSDQKNLNRMFPGKKDGTEAERLAYWLTETVFKEVDYILDLHGGDMIEALVPFSIYHASAMAETVEKSKLLASLFDINYVIGSKDQVPGSTYGSAAKLGIPAIIAEAGQQGILSPDHSKRLQDGVLNVLKSLKVIEGEAKSYPSHFLETFDWYRADVQGLWYPEVAIGDHVKEGDRLGTIQNEFGEIQVEIVSHTNGVVLFLVTSLAINPNDPLLSIGD